jgi:hypothetical protein
MAAKKTWNMAPPDYCQNGFYETHCMPCFEAVTKIMMGDANMNALDFLGDGCELQRMKRRQKCKNASQFSTSQFDNVTDAAKRFHTYQVETYASTIYKPRQ